MQVYRETVFAYSARHHLRPFPGRAPGGFDFLSAGFLFVEALKIIRVLGAHPAIPPGKIEPEIPCAALVMHIVMGDSGQPSKDRHPGPAAREYFVSAMRQSILKDHDSQHDIQRQIVGRDQHQSDRDIQVLNHGFACGKIISRERRWIVRAMVLHMRPLVELGGNAWPGASNRNKYRAR